MNNEPSRLHEILERATAAGDDIPPDLDAETVSLRQGWLGLCKLMEDEGLTCGDGQQRVDMRTIDERHVEKFVETPAETVDPVKHRSHSGWSRWALAAVAASLLIAAGASIAVKLLNRSNEPRPNSQQIARGDAPAQPAIDRDATPNPTATPANQSDRPIASTADRLAWGDSVDDEIAAAGRDTMLVRQDWYAQAGAVGAIQSGLDELEKEMDQGPL